LPQLAYLEAIRQGIWEKMERDPSVFCIGEDIGIYGGAFKVTDGFIDRFGAERVIDTPIAESAIVGAAFGASLTGLRPVAEFQFMDFIGCAFNQIVNMVGSAHYRWGAPAPLVLQGASRTRRPSSQRDHLRGDALHRARSSRASAQRRNRNRNPRPAHSRAARSRGDCRDGEEDEQSNHPSRALAHWRIGRRNFRHRQRRSLRRSRWPNRQDHRARHPRPIFSAAGRIFSAQSFRPRPRSSPPARLLIPPDIYFAANGASRFP